MTSPTVTTFWGTILNSGYAPVKCYCKKWSTLKMLLNDMMCEMIKNIISPYSYLLKNAIFLIKTTIE